MSKLARIDLLLTLWSWCRSDVGERRKVFLYFLWYSRSAKCHRRSPCLKSPFSCSRKGFSGRALWIEELANGAKQINLIFEPSRISPQNIMHCCWTRLWQFVVINKISVWYHLIVFKFKQSEKQNVIMGWFWEWAHFWSICSL